MLWDLFAFAGPAFWALFVVLGIFVILTIEGLDSPRSAAVAVLVFAALCLGFSDSAAWLWAHMTKRNVLLAVVGYPLAGVAFAFAKWYLFLDERRDQWRDVAAGFRRRYNIPAGEPVLPSKCGAPLRDYLATLPYTQRYNFLSHDLTTIRIRPHARDHKRQIAEWIGFWLWLLPWSIIDDFVIGLGKWAYRRVAGSMDAMARAMFREFEDDAAAPEVAGEEARP